MGYGGTISPEICDGISGEIGNFVLDENHPDDLYTPPINILVLNITKEDDESNKIGFIEEVR